MAAKFSLCGTKYDETSGVGRIVVTLNNAENWTPLVPSFLVPSLPPSGAGNWNVAATMEPRGTAKWNPFFSFLAFSRRPQNEYKLTWVMYGRRRTTINSNQWAGAEVRRVLSHDNLLRSCQGTKGIWTVVKNWRDEKILLKEVLSVYKMLNSGNGTILNAVWEIVIEIVNTSPKLQT